LQYQAFISVFFEEIFDIQKTYISGATMKGLIPIVLMVLFLLSGCSVLFADGYIGDYYAPPDTTNYVYVPPVPDPYTPAETFYWRGINELDYAVCDSLLESGFDLNANSDEIAELFLDDLNEQFLGIDDAGYYNHWTEEDYEMYYTKVENAFLDFVSMLAEYGFEVRNKDDFVSQVNDFGLEDLAAFIAENIPEIKPNKK
jgi:hypothetical protein